MDIMKTWFPFEQITINLNKHGNFQDAEFLYDICVRGTHHYCTTFEEVIKILSSYDTIKRTM